MALTASYVLTRADYVLMSVALTRRPLLQRIIRAFLFVLGALFIGISLGTDSDAGYFETLLDMMKAIASGEMPIWFYAIYIVVAAVALFSHWITGLVACLLFSRVPTKGLLHDVELGEKEVAIRAPNMASTISWSAIKRVVEERTFFLAILSNRQSVLLPRRAFPDDTSYANALAFARAHAGLALQ